MAKEDGNINIGTKIDTKGAESGLNKLTTKLNKLADNKTLKGISNVGMAIGGIASSFSLVSKGVKIATQQIKECEEAYIKQKNAEIQLQTAAKNNPYLNKQSVENLKNYASELQSISIYGDEELIPYITELVSSGRTQAEIMDIMTASVNAASSGIIDLGSAVQSLNLSYSGQIGALGKVLPNLKNLTKEELESGKAVEEVKKQFEGMAKKTSEITGSSIQLKNAMGDLREEMGKPYSSALSSIRQYFTELISGWTNALAAKRKYQEGIENITEELGNNEISAEEFVSNLEELARKDTEEKIKKLKEELLKYKEMAGSDLDTIAELENRYQKKIDAVRQKGAEKTKKQIEQTFLPYESALENNLNISEEKFKAFVDRMVSDTGISIDAIILLQEKYSMFSEPVAAGLNKLKPVTTTATKNNNTNNSSISTNATSNRKSFYEMYKEYEKANKDVETTQILKGKIGKGLTKEEELQEKLNAKIESYIKLRLEAGTLMSDTNPTLSLAQFNAEIEALEKELGIETKKNETIEKLKASLSDIEFEDPRKVSEKLKAQLEELDKLYNEALEQSNEDKLAIYEEYTEKRKELDRQITEAEKEELKKQRDETINSINEIVSTVDSAISSLTDSGSSLADLFGEDFENQNKQEIADLEKLYEEGAVSYEDYQNRLQEIDKEAEKKRYQVELAKWSMTLATATSDAAAAIISALKEPYPMNIINAALVGTTGGVQLASIIANKPIPKYATGGIIGGNNYNDGIMARVSSGEMILNNRQQAELFRLANKSGNASGMTQQIIVNNSISDRAKVSASVSNNQIMIAINDAVKSEMNRGTYTQTLNNALSKSTGVKYL